MDGGPSIQIVGARFASHIMLVSVIFPHSIYHRLRVSALRDLSRSEREDVMDLAGSIETDVHPGTATRRRRACVTDSPNSLMALVQTYCSAYYTRTEVIDS